VIDEVVNLEKGIPRLMPLEERERITRKQKRPLKVSLLRQGGSAQAVEEDLIMQEDLIKREREISTLRWTTLQYCTTPGSS
jgi:hypothetical protein